MWFELLVAFLASWQVVETYENGSLFARIRGWAAENHERSLVAELLWCMFCFSHHPPYLLWIWILVAHRYEEIGYWMQIVPLWLATVRLVQLARKLTEPNLFESAVIDERPDAKD